jgi:hypothetical protein
MIEVLRSQRKPTPADFTLAALVGQLFYLNGGGQALLNDADAGWRTGTGDWILQNHSAPKVELFSFSRPGASWFSWEWLSDVILALVYQHWGLAGVAFLGGCVILPGALVLFLHSPSAWPRWPPASPSKHGWTLLSGPPSKPPRGTTPLMAGRWAGGCGGEGQEMGYLATVPGLLFPVCPGLPEKGYSRGADTNV